MAIIHPEGWRELKASGAAQREIETLALLAYGLPAEYTVYHGVHWTRIGNGYALYNTLTPDQTRALSTAVDALTEPLSKVETITMYGEGNSAKLLSDIVNGTTQVTEGISAGMGLDLKSLLAGALGGKLAAGNSQPVQVTVAPQAQPDAAAASADAPEQQV